MENSSLPQIVEFGVSLSFNKHCCRLSGRWRTFSAAAHGARREPVPLTQIVAGCLPGGELQPAADRGVWREPVPFRHIAVELHPSADLGVLREPVPLMHIAAGCPPCGELQPATDCGVRREPVLLTQIAAGCTTGGELQPAADRGVRHEPVPLTRIPLQAVRPVENSSLPLIVELGVSLSL